MAKSTALSHGLLLAIFNAVGLANLLDNTATAPATTLTVALHTADPGPGGTQATNEIVYTGYARLAVARTSSGFTVTGASVSPAANLDFATSTGGAGGTVTHWSVGTGVADALLVSGPVTPNIVVATGVLPRLTTATAHTES